jgi:hypothetical protein
MYVLIDRQQMAIVHKHRDVQTLRDLSWIECTNAGLIMPLGRVEHWTKEFTPAELKLIYKNATGAELQGYGNVLGSVVNQMAMRLPETAANPAEVAAQRLCVMDGDKSSFSYCPGSQRPTSHPGLFEPDPIKCERNPAEEATAAASKPAYAPTTPASAGPADPFGAPSSTPRAPSAPRTGGSRETIYKVADDMWEAAGKPTDLKVVLDLRRQIMAVLETEHSVKKTTSSTALGDWQKSRLS